MMLSLIVAADEGNVIGGQNRLLWRLPDDLAHFRGLTRGHAIIMGRKTYASIGRVLPERRNIIITRQASVTVPGAEVVHSLEEALTLAASTDDEEVFIIGGGEIYRQALPLAERIYLTRVHARMEGDIVFPELRKGEWREVSREEHPADASHEYAFTFLVYERVK